MAHFLMLGSSEQPWRIHVTEDIEDIRRRLSTGTVSAVQCVTADQLDPTTVYVNPQNLGWWAIVEAGD